MLVLVVAVLVVSYASSLRAYLQQRAHIGELKSQIAQRERDITSLEREKQRWDDPEFLKQQARARFGYVMPGQTGLIMLGADGKPLESQTSLVDPEDVAPEAPTAWWTHEWESVKLAGNPPAPDQGPAAEIDGVTKQ